MNQRQYIRLEAEANPQGVRIVCPWCGGGSDEERCMQVWSATAYRCFRATCGRGQGQPTEVNGLAQARAPRVFSRPTYYLTSSQSEFLASKYGYCPAEITYCEEMNRFILPVRDYNEHLRGHIARSLIGDKPKTINYQSMQDQPFSHWPKLNRLLASNAVFVVEDWFSAERINWLGHRACAILGTHLNLDKAEELKRVQGNGRIFLALDQDATGKAIGYCAKYQELLPGLRVLPLTVDIKDMRIKDALELLNNAAISTSISSYSGQQERV